MAKIGIIGCGDVAKFGHVPAILRTQGLKLVAHYDPNPLQVASLTELAPHSKGFSSEKSFFAQNLDAVIICAAAGAHKQNLFAAAERGLHVLCEKPLALTDADAQSMVDEMDRVKKMLFTGFVYRFSPVALQLKEWVKTGRVGEVRSLRLIYIWDLHGEYAQDAQGKWIKSPRYVNRMLEGGPMVDCGVHQIDLARWWLGSEVREVTAAGAWVAGYEAPDHMYLHLNHENGAHTMVETSFSYGHTVREPRPQFTYDLIGDGGVLRYDRDGYILEARHGEGTLRVHGASEKNFDGMYHEFAKALSTGKPGEMATGQDGVIATRIARDATNQLIANHNKTQTRISLSATGTA